MGTCGEKGLEGRQSGFEMTMMLSGSLISEAGSSL